jgi:hypothetical protein
MKMPYRNKPVVAMGHEYVGEGEKVCADCNLPGTFQCSTQNKYLCAMHHEAHWDECVNAIRTTKINDSVNLKKE